MEPKNQPQAHQIAAADKELSWTNIKRFLMV